MYANIDKFIQACSNCQRVNVKREGFHPLQSITADQPWEHITLDLVTTLPPDAGYTNLLVVTDIFSKYVVLHPLKSKTMEEVVSVFWSILAEYGLPKIMQSDNGTEFVNQVVDRMLNSIGVEKKVTSPYNPRTNGMTERFNQTLITTLKKLTFKPPFLNILFNLNNRINFKS